MKHPFQHILLDSTGEYFFAAAINTVFVFKLSDKSVKLLASWTDEVDPYYTIRKHHKELLEQYEQQQREKAEQEAAAAAAISSASNDNNKRPIIPEEQIPASKKQIMHKRPKLPLPGPGAPPTYTYIRDMCLSRDNQYLIVTTDNDKAVVIFKINYNSLNDEFLTLIKRQPILKRPSSVCTSIDDSNVIIADKFGDVFSIPLKDSNIIEDSKLEPILGHVSMLTCVQNSIDENNNEVIFTADRDEHIRISYYPKTFIIKKILFGHNEFISSFILPNWCNNKILVSGGGDNFICIWNWQINEELNELKSKFNINNLIIDKLNEKHLVPEKFQNESNNLVEYCISKIIPIDKTKQLAIIFEKIPSLFIFDLTENGEISFNKEYPVESDIITITASNDKLILSFDNMNKVLRFFKINEDKSFTIDENNDLLVKLINDANDSIIGDVDELIPLFNTNYMRKRREH